MDKEANLSLVRGLGLLAAVSIIIGNVIGTGVFFKARVMTCNVGSPVWVIAAWIAAGLLSLAGALTFAELAAAMPKAGGSYNYLQKAYGRIWSFLFGWMQIFIARTGSQAAVAVAMAILINDLTGGKLKQIFYSANVFGAVYEFSNLSVIAVGLIAFVTILNCATVSLSGGVATVLTFVKIALVLFVGIGAFLLADGSFGNFGAVTAGAACAAGERFGTEGYAFMAGFAAAMVAALWGYDGWDNLTFVAGEVKNPSRNIPIATIGGTVLVIVLYVFVNVAYFYVLTPDMIAGLSKDSSVAQEVATRFLGAGAVTLMLVGLMASSFGTLHTSVLSGSRIPFAMAADGMFPKSLSKVSERTRVPVRAILAQGVWASLLALSGSFDVLTDYVVFGSWIFYALATSSIFVFRTKYPEMERPYKAFGYPVVPVLFLLVATWLLLTTLYNKPVSSFTGIGLILLGLPIYFYLVSRNTATADSVDEK